MSETEYLQLAGNITEKLDNTAEYEDWLTIQDYIDDLKSQLLKEQLSYAYLRDSFSEKFEENQLLKIQVSAREEVANKYKEVIEEVNKLLEENYLHYDSYTGDSVYWLNEEICLKIKEIIDKANIKESD